MNSLCYRDAIVSTKLSRQNKIYISKQMILSAEGAR